ncbi:ferritin-like domain-containing protein [Hymenobacter metallilatus]|uniref:Ferritin-like domain-containing protein n=1 Tax=Hymenobacter metallilatus TaxID=2493666 RepID=A0A428JPR3_9BACT|nr:ferritin-like domain-containing protein [Hymenobacter metallilatus]RSK35323.1 ferritin-like domain-containing protein [Hymenobacter metallilatus]
MNFLHLLARLATLDTEHTALTQAPRRAALSRLGQAGTALLPALLAGLATPAQAGQKEVRTRLDALKLILKLENLQNAFYSRALGLLPGGPANPATFFGSAATRDAIQTIQSQQQKHAALYGQLITNAGSALDASPNYDFTGSRNGTQPAVYPDVYTNPDTFLKVAQLLKDASVQTYKGQAAFLQSDNYLLETTVRAHSTEARHAAHIRTLRRQRGATVKSWVSATDTAITTAGSPQHAVYTTETNINQYVSLSGLVTRVPFDSTLPINVGTPALSASALLAKVAEAFDEPIESVTAESILQVFTY